MLRDPANATLRRRVRELLEGIAADRRHGIARILDADQLSRLGAFPEAAFLVEFAPGFLLGPGLRGELLTPAGSRGTHGYLPDRPEMRASLMVLGPGVAAGRDLGIVDLRQLAPTLADILGVPLLAMSGPPLDIRTR
jgi:hypothetical protein